MLEIRSVSKSFDGQAILKDVHLSIPKGDFFSLLGPSGCGKTTLLRILAGFERPDSGDVIFDGKSIVGLSPKERPFNIVFQRYALFPHLTVAQNVAFGPRVKGVKESEIKSRVLEALKGVQMEDYIDRRVDNLSGGQQQRVALARAIVNRPQVLLLDEPLSALDQKLRESTRVEMLGIQRRLGITFILVTHDQEEALTMSDKIAIMNGGKVEQCARPEEIYRRPASKFVADFVGSINIVERDGKSSFLRPEEIQISKNNFGTDQDFECSPQGVIREILFKGAITDIIVDSPWAQSVTKRGHFIVQIPSSWKHGLEVSDQVYLRWPNASIVGARDGMGT